MTGTWIKTYPSVQAAAKAAAHYDWISDTGQLSLPDLLLRDGPRLAFAHVPGRHVEPADLPDVARALALFHAAAHQHLDRIPAGSPHHTHRGLTIPGFTDRRQDRLQQLVTAPTAPDTWLTPSAIRAWMDRAALLPAAVYKDANVRNFLLTDAATIGVDFDVLTLAPLGYDLGKLVVSAVMTYGPLAAALLDDTVTSYNTVLAEANLPSCMAEEFTAWAEIHHILTSPHQGRNGNQYSWTSVRSHR